MVVVVLVATIAAAIDWLTHFLYLSPSVSVFVQSSSLFISCEVVSLK